MRERERGIGVCGLCSRYVLLVSGLGIGSSWSDQLSIEMLVDYITGQLGGVSVSSTFIFTLIFSFVCPYRTRSFALE